MLLQSIINVINQQFPQKEFAKAEKRSTQPIGVEKEKTFSDMIGEAKTPASAATFAAAEEAKGMKRIELEIAAAAGLLRPMSPEPPPQAKETPQQHNQSHEELLRTIKGLKNPEELHNFDLFE